MNNRTDPILYIVIPCYNEQEVLPITAPMFLQKLADLTAAGKISPESRVLFVNDGSKDRTWEIICDLAARDPHYVGICQSRNRGHQNAVLAGLMEAKSRCDITISIDCDGQDDINAMDAMVDAYRDGCDVVYGVRSKRDTDTFFKRFTAESPVQGGQPVPARHGAAGRLQVHLRDLRAPRAHRGREPLSPVQNAGAGV